MIAPVAGSGSWPSWMARVSKSIYGDANDAPRNRVRSVSGLRSDTGFTPSSHQTPSTRRTPALRSWTGSIRPTIRSHPPRSFRFPSIEKLNAEPPMMPRLLTRVLLLFAGCGVFGLPVHAQQHTQNEDVVRVNTELVQTNFMVFDKQGNFIDNLKKDQLVLKIDGKPREI